MVSKEDKVRKILKAMFDIWHETWDRNVRVFNKGLHLRKIKDRVGHWPWVYNKCRAVETVLAKLRIGHSNVKNHNYRFNLSETPLCDCGQRETIDHIILNCELYCGFRFVMRMKLNDLNVPLSTKNVLGGGDFCEKTQMLIINIFASFLRKTGKLHIL